MSKKVVLFEHVKVREAFRGVHIFLQQTSLRLSDQMPIVLQAKEVWGGSGKFC